MAKFVFQAGVFFNTPLYPAPTSTVVTVYDVSGESPVLAPIWNDRDGSDPKSNPFGISSAGILRFYANPGRYRVTAVNGANSQSWEDVILLDPEAGGGGGGAASFVDLDDVPASYSGQGYKAVRVNSAASSLEFSPEDVVRGEATKRTSSFTLAATMHNDWIELDGDVTVTIPAESTVDLSLPDNRAFMVHFAHTGGGTALFSPAGGVTLLLPADGAATLSSAGQRVTVQKSTTAANTWHIYGQTDGA